MILLDLRLLPVLPELMLDSFGGGASLASAWNEMVLCIVVREDIGSTGSWNEMKELCFDGIVRSVQRSWFVGQGCQPSMEGCV